MPTKAKLTTRSISTTTVTTDSIPKGTGLTNAELDSNFLNLRDQSIAISDGTTTTDIEAGETITFSGATVAGNTVTISGGGGGLTDLVNDTSPQLGGDLDVNGQDITTSGNGSMTLTTVNGVITINPNSTSASGGTGNLNIGYNTVANIPDIVFRDIINYDNDYHSGVGPSDYISTGGIINAITCSGDLLLGAGYTNQAGTEDSTNNIVLDARLTRIYGNGTNAILTTAQGNDLVLTVQESNDSTSDANIGVNSGLIKINAGSNADIEISPHGTGRIDFNSSTSTSIGTNGSASAPTANPVGYLKIKINGTEYQIPYYNI
jgi:hypothetical protein